MNALRLFLAAYLGLLTLLWLLADNLFAAGYAFFDLRRAVVNGTGILAIGAMSLGLLLAARPAWVDARLGGLDKGYRLHKWLGIAALLLSVLHWAWVQVPKWMVGWGWLEKPARKATGSEPSALAAFFNGQRGLAESIGEWAFYAALLLIALALYRRFPYRHFFKTHRLLAPVYLVLAYHSLILMKHDYWSAAVGPLVALLIAAGSGAALLSLGGRIGARRKAIGTVEAIELHPDNHVLGVDVRLHDRWPGHAAGQFAFVTFDRAEGPHPFTISSAWQGDGRLRFNIKGLGDYTARLPHSLQVGDAVCVEGPYGRFDFAPQERAQAWIAGGIGITPFIARLQDLAGRPAGRPIDLIYCTNAPDAGFIARLEALAEAAQVRLHLRVSGRDPRLDCAGLCALLPDWQTRDFWFCGPAAFGAALRSGLEARGLPATRFHQELFDMR